MQAIGEQTGRAEGVVTQKKCRKYTAEGISVIGQQDREREREIRRSGTK